eukprot:Seg2061.3 transcript_id=Seg2061.3/GoldUCD/mRNA.D3Y31 product="Arylsulfatase B" protein_id=Seg2061.3/GoldUCD/D3Y31
MAALDTFPCECKHLSNRGISLYISLLLTLLSTRLAFAAKRPPHIILAIADDLGWSDLGYQNLSKIRTPFIDKLAKEGIILTNHYVQPLCSPSRASLLTGKYAIHLGAGLNENVFSPDEDAGLPLQETLLPEKLQDLGYKTALFGKWHLGSSKPGYLPTRRGFDRFYGFYSGAIDYYTHNQTAHRCKTRTASYLDFRNQEEIVRNRQGEYSQGIFNEEAVNFITNHDTKQPLFLMMSFQSVHDPLQVPSQYSSMYKDIEDTERRTYAGMTSYLDDSMRNFTNAVKNAGMWENTVMIFMSDNGGNPTSAGYNWPLRGAKGTVWEGGIRSTSFVSGGFLKEAGFESNALIHVSDWFPTVLNLAKNRLKKKRRRRLLSDSNKIDKFVSDSSPTSKSMVSSLKDANVSTSQQEFHQNDSRNFEARQNASLVNRSKRPIGARSKRAKTPLDGVNVWKAITNKNRDSPREFVIHNINNQSYAVRKGRWKLISELDMGWLKPPEGTPGFAITIKGRPLDPKKFNGYLLDPKLPRIRKGLFDISVDEEERNDLSNRRPDIVKELYELVERYKKTIVPYERTYTCNQKAVDKAKDENAWGPFSG